MVVSEQAPALDVEDSEEKKKVVTEDDFEERLARIRRYLTFILSYRIGPSVVCLFSQAI